MSFGRFPAGGPWLLPLSLSNAVWTRTCNFTLSCILVSSIFTVCPGGGGGCGGTGVAHNCVFLCIVKLLAVLIRRAEYSGYYFKWPRILVTFHLLILMFWRLVILPSSGEITERTLLGARDRNSCCLRITAVRNVLFPRPKRLVISVRQFSETSLLRTFIPLKFVCEVCVKFSDLCDNWNGIKIFRKILHYLRLI
jgi:hypothetical protein